MEVVKTESTEEFVGITLVRIMQAAMINKPQMYSGSKQQKLICPPHKVQIGVLTRDSGAGAQAHSILRHCCLEHVASRIAVFAYIKPVDWEKASWILHERFLWIRLEKGPHRS